MGVVDRMWLPVLCALLQAVAVSTGARHSDTDAASGLFTLIGVASGLALVARHRAPLATLAVAGVGYVLQVLVNGPALPAAVAVMTCVVARGAAPSETSGGRPLRLTVAALCGGVASVVVPLAATGYVDEAGPYGFVTLTAGLAGLLVSLYASRELERRRELLAAERLRIARDLHDIVGHGLGAITVQAGAARMAIAAGADDDATRSLTAIEAAGRGVLREVRWLVGLLREDGEHPGIGAVVDLVGNARRCGLDVTFSVAGDLDQVRADAGEAAYRILQEALTNVLRHAGGCGADVVVRVHDDLDLCIGNCAAGVPAQDADSPVDGNGVRGMRERAGAVGGSLQAGPTPDGSGWTVRARLPLGRRSG
jgi:signal transduction histidine kinase